MSVQAADTSVRTSIVVDVPIARAFSVFTEEIGTWWNPEHHILKVELAEMVFEPWAGGRAYDVGVDGSECTWARVLAFEPPDRLLLSWDVSLQWEREPDPDKTSEVEVRFTAEAPDRTRVDLEHRKLDRHGAGWQSMRDAVGAHDGWTGELRRYAAVVEPG